MSSLACNKTVLDSRFYEWGLGATRTNEVFSTSDYENPLWQRVIGKIEGGLFVMAFAYILCFASVTLLITFLEIDVEAILALDILLYFGFWLLGASFLIFVAGLILRGK